MRAMSAFVVTVFLGACHQTMPNNHSPSLTGSKPALPICGVVTTKGYRVQDSETDSQFSKELANAIFLVPVALNAHLVKRYQIVDHHRMPGFLEAHGGWWVCVEKGQVIREAFAEPGDYSTLVYGVIIVEEFSAHLSNGERGAE